ncbi:MAG TPA: glutamate synthase subunit beta, partial [Candidatus Sphingobacterium stercorigallinarum]|nr:glutamate synthase subunit beta [Candidatus Sphingobacterium stercorigallinarum]
AGHQVTVYERDDKAGGLLRYGIPDFKLDKTIVDRRIDLLRESGITFRLNAEVGQNVTTDELKQYDAVVLAVGSTVPRDLPVPGRSLSGVHFAMEFLKQQNKRLSGSLPDGQNISAEGKNVVVIGGGDTGSDCVGTSNRQGATSVTQLELLPLPPTERTANMPWPSYPMLLKTTSSHEEGCQRHWAINTKAFIGDERNQLRAIKVVDVKWEIDPQGRPSGFVEIAGTEREIPCELVTLALGFLHPQKEGLLDELGIELTERGQVAADECSFQTNIPHIFAAGDLRRGQSLVVWAISEGRECAKKVDEFLMGSSSLESKDRETERHLAH